MGRFIARCIECENCDTNQMLCHPNDEDCLSEYKLDKFDLSTPARCDFFKRRTNPNPPSEMKN